MQYRIPIGAACFCFGAVLAQAQTSALTAQYGPERTNSNQQEHALNPQSVGSGAFGKLFSRRVDGGIYAAPLIVPNVEFGRGKRKTTRDLLFAATMANTVYAFDAVNPEAEDPIWAVTLGPPMIPSGSLWFLSSSFGIISTPAIDPTTGTLYAVAKVQNSPADVGLYLFALDIATGEFKYNSPQRMRFPYEGDEIAHVPDAIQRAGLLVDDGVLYVAVAAVYPDRSNRDSQEGYVQALDASDLAVRLGSMQVTPNGLKGGIWQAGRGIAADAEGNVYVATAGGSYDGISDWGSSVLKLAPRTLTVLDWFTPSNWEQLYLGNLDISANGVTLIPDSSLAFAGGKEGVIYLLDRNNMGRLEAPPNVPLQRFDASDGCGLTDCAQTLGTAFWTGGVESLLFVWDRTDNLRGYAFGPGGTFAVAPYSTTVFDPAPLMTGGPSVSSAGTDLASAIVWAVTTDGNANDQFQTGVLRAFAASDLTQELYNSNSAASDALGTFTKFAPPVVANGHVYVPTLSSSATDFGSVEVYGLLCQQDGASLVEINAKNPKGPRKRLSQDFIVTNTGGGALAGPFALALDGLSAGVNVSNADGATSCAAPEGSPYVIAQKGPTWLQPGDAVTFRVSYSEAEGGIGSDSVRFLFGSGER